MTNLPEVVTTALDKLGWGEDFDYFELEHNGLVMRTAKRYVKIKDAYEYHIFPAFAGFEPRIRLDWDLAKSAADEEEDVEVRLKESIYHQLMQDLFEILEVVADKNVSSDIYLPVIPESAYV